MTKIVSPVTVSLVSHGHGQMVWHLLAQLLKCPEVIEVIITLNIPEDVPLLNDGRVRVIRNVSPKGFGANHNAAFQLCHQPCFCVLNPDIELSENPFPGLLANLQLPGVGLVAPRVLNAAGLAEDSARRFITPWSMLLRVLGLDSGAYQLSAQSTAMNPEWVAGMFMLFNAGAYQKLGGFDEAYFMYCEDADICTRLWKSGERVRLCPEVAVIHLAQRASRRSFRHLRWHVASLLRYFARYWGRLPNPTGSL